MESESFRFKRSCLQYVNGKGFLAGNHCFEEKRLGTMHHFFEFDWIPHLKPRNQLELCAWRKQLLFRGASGRAHRRCRGTRSRRRSPPVRDSAALRWLPSGSVYTV